MCILQLTISAIVFIVISGVSFFLVEIWSGDRLERWRSAPLTGSIGDECLAIELAILPLAIGILACWGVVRVLRMRPIHNEFNDTFRPILTVTAGYGRFVLIIVSASYLVLGHGWAAFAHLVIAVAAFALFHHRHRKRERAIEEHLLAARAEDDDES